MNESRDSMQVRDWLILHDRITDILDRFGEKNYLGKGDYWLVDDNYGWKAHLLEVQNLDLFQPEIISLLQNELYSYPDWSIEMGAYVSGGVDVSRKDTNWPGMGIVI